MEKASAQELCGPIHGRTFPAHTPLLPTNNVAEVVALGVALLRIGQGDIAPGSHVELAYDSEWARSAVTGNMRFANSRLCQEVNSLLRTISARFTLTWRKIKAHQGDWGNERADALAKQGARGRRVTPPIDWGLWPPSAPFPPKHWSQSRPGPSA